MFCNTAERGRTFWPWSGRVNASTTTVADGIYGFNNLLAGAYTVCTTAGIPAGYAETYDLDGPGTANCATVSVGPSTTAVNFGYNAPPPVSGTCVAITAKQGVAITR